MLYKRQERRTDTCPSYAEVETHRHVLKCHSNRATTAYRVIQRNFESWLDSTTSRDIKMAVMKQLQAYREEEMVVDIGQWTEPVVNASREQMSRGPNAFIEGLLVKELEVVQSRHLEVTQSKRQPGRWTKELIKKLWLISWDMWDSRNDEVHNTAATRKAVIIAQLNSEVRETHSWGRTNDFLPRIEREFFTAQVEDIIQQTEYQKRTWLHIAQRFIERDRQRVARSRSIQIMREYLQPGVTAHIVRHQTHIIRQSKSNFRAPAGTRRGPNDPTN
mmetsp:Transcript_17274/g.25154  ORF Transcript_17274/g.25154 Transcript_17274/m.25154 type:complete len:275 (-) Transcript_17274:138-962(-)